MTPFTKQLHEFGPNQPAAANNYDLHMRSFL
jgi:hypothetical protein